MQQPDTNGTLISNDYLATQKKLHENPKYGVASLTYAPVVANIIRATGVKSVCDYGAGKMNLKTALMQAGLQFDYFPYDPVFPEYGEARSADLVCCIDVLEHIEPEYLNNVLAHLARITVNIGFFTVALNPAKKTLPDGRNAHLIQKPSSWWLPQLCQFFETDSMLTNPHGFWVLTRPRKLETVCAEK